MEKREKIIQLWFDMWLKQQDLGIQKLFTDNAIYTESWGPQYKGSAKIKLWFEEWNQRGQVLLWDIQQFFHKDDQSVVQWHFKNHMKDGRVEEFDGMSLIHWAETYQIQSLKEFGCNCRIYDPYANSSVPQFQTDPIKWF